MNNYHNYHLHPINKLIHFFCIPMIVTTTINFSSIIKISLPLVKTKIKLNYFLLFVYNVYYYKISWKVYFFMMLYFKLLFIISYYWKKRIIIGNQIV